MICRLKLHDLLEASIIVLRRGRLKVETWRLSSFIPCFCSSLSLRRGWVKRVTFYIRRGKYMREHVSNFSFQIKEDRLPESTQSYGGVISVLIFFFKFSTINRRFILNSFFYTMFKFVYYFYLVWNQYYISVNIIPM